MESARSLTRSILVVLVPVSSCRAVASLGNSDRPISECISESPASVKRNALRCRCDWHALEGTRRTSRSDGYAASATDSPIRRRWLCLDWSDISPSASTVASLGLRYLSRKLQKCLCMAMMIAAPISIVGLGTLLSASGWTGSVCVSILAACFASALFWKFARDTHCVLYVTRHEIMRRLT